MKAPVPSEKFEQLRLVSWLQAKGLKFTHVVGNASSRRRGAQNKAMGMSAGFPDLIIVVRAAVLFVELKRQRGGRVSDEQAQWIFALHEAGAHARVCNGFEKAKAFVEEFL